MVNAKSVKSNARPMLMLVYFLKIAAMTSVPPLEEPMLKSTAELNAGSAIAKASSSIG